MLEIVFVGIDSVYVVCVQVGVAVSLICLYNFCYFKFGLGWYDTCLV